MRSLQQIHSLIYIFDVLYDIIYDIIPTERSYVYGKVFIKSADPIEKRGRAMG